MHSPKQPPGEERRDWYPYYAGFPERFATSCLARYGVTGGSVLDPWNGAGTTVAAALKQGCVAAGIDVNPAATVIARARLTPPSIVDSLNALGAEIVAASSDRSPTLESSDLLTVWMRPSTAMAIRRIQTAILEIVGPDKNSPSSTIADVADHMPVLAAFYTCALFATARDMLAPFRASNPTWLKTPATHRNRIATRGDSIASRFLDRVEFLAGRLSMVTSSPAATITTGSASALPFTDEQFDFCLTSPPYATRIDYVYGLLPELAVLGATRSELRELRTRSTGGPVLPDRHLRPDLQPSSSEAARELMDRIWSHSSKGSRSYYYPWMGYYLHELEMSLSELHRVVKKRGVIGIVVQDSFYKEIRINLQRIIEEMMAHVGRARTDRIDHRVAAPRSTMNGRARKHLASRCNQETLLVFS